MLTADGCRARRQRLLRDIPGPLLLGDPLNLRYFANLYSDPFSYSADFGGLLFLAGDGRSTLYADTRLPKANLAAAHADEIVPVPWYDGKSPGRGPRRLILRDIVQKHGGRIHDAVNDESSEKLWQTVSEMRRAKNPDEIELLKTCMRITEAGHDWGRRNAQPGMTELQVYAGMAEACTLAAGKAVVVYGDFAVSPGSARRGGPPTDHSIQAGEMLILDFSVIVDGYRSDFTNTLVVGKPPTADQKRLFDLCIAAMAAGEAKLRAGTPCLEVYRSVRGVFDAAGVGEAFPIMPDTGSGLTHPEAPFFVEKATETLVEGDVVTLEPGLYLDGIGGIRIEHNYLVTASGFERLSNHTIALQ